MWSDNKRINQIINILIVLFSMNFFNYGQLIVPLICLILFVNGGFKININNKKTFVLLILFGVSFFAFSYKLGIYSTIGLFFPMAFYIGSNLRTKNVRSLIYVIYLIGLGMSLHLVLNLGYELAIRGFNCFFRNSHLDFWTKGEYPTTQTAINYVFIYSCLYYLICYETNKKIKACGLSLSLVSVIYSFALGRRTPYILLSIAIVGSVMLDCFMLKNKNKYNKWIILSFVALISSVAIMFIISKTNFLNLADKIKHISIINKLLLFGYSSSRLEIMLQTIKIMPYHLFGGQEIMTTLGIEPHNLWFDIYDYAGIVPMAIFVAYTFFAITKVIKYLNNLKNKKAKSLIITLCILSFLQMCIEPVITGGSIFMLSVTVIISILESLYNVEEEKPYVQE